MMSINRLIIALFVLSLFSCVTKVTQQKVANAPFPTELYVGNLSWKDLSNGLEQGDGQVNCLYHLVHFDINTEGKVHHVEAKEYSHSGGLSSTLAAVQQWRFEPNTELRKGIQAVILYRKQGKPIVYTFPADLEVKAQESVKVDETRLPNKRVPPNYPKRAALNGIQGEVTLLYKVDKDGIPTDIQVTKGIPPYIFDATSINAVRQWRYSTGSEVSLQSATIEYELMDTPTACRF